MRLLYDQADLPDAKKLRDNRFQWLHELDAAEIHDVAMDEECFLFGYHRGGERLRQQVGNRPSVHDRPEEREELTPLDYVLGRLQERSIDVPAPKTWILRLDEEPPADLEFPLFLRTPGSSWKRGGQQAKVNNLRQLNDEAELLRRTFGWDVPILARQWLDLAVAGQWMFGDAPQEVRVWLVDHVPAAWSFHYLNAVARPKGFPPSNADLALIASLAAKVAYPFRSCRPRSS